MEIVVRRAVPEDIGSLLVLLKQLFEIERDFAFDEARQRTGLELMMTDEAKNHILVAECGRGVVGMCTAQILISTAEGGPVGWVEDVAVLEGFRGRGIGAKLLEGLEAWARARGLTRLQLLADRDNRAGLEFYGRAGWSETGLVGMRKSLRRQ